MKKLIVLFALLAGCASLERSSPDPIDPPDAPPVVVDPPDAPVPPPDECPPPPPPPCECDEDCGDGQTCRHGTCYERCRCDDDCESGYGCRYGACKPE